MFQLVQKLSLWSDSTQYKVNPYCIAPADQTILDTRFDTGPHDENYNMKMYLAINPGTLFCLRET